ncbi:MAG TPA: CaiB/BaiF CoA-transferase family protein [Thermomicrobiaceae bacterium]|nr:CaiB/BaiF CoA-transferase family protein [Thermomicrobiaceae bacterium]
MLPLEGITVVALEQAVAAPFATRQLADLGARVIKIERPGSGDFARGYDRAVNGIASFHVWLNRSKESLTLNVKHPEGVQILDSLLARADVFVHNLAPGAIGRLGFGAPVLRERFPRLITCEISGYGSSGPYRDKKAYDLLIQCETGLVSVTGTPETPSKAGISAADISAGMYAFSGILTALYRRERTGEGATLEVSLFESLGEWMSHPAYITAYTGRQPPRAGASHASIAPYGPFATGDGATVNLGVQNEREWVRFCAVVLRRPEVADDPRFGSPGDRMAHRAALDAVIEDVFTMLSAEEVVDRLEEAQIANARMRSVQEFIDHPQLAARGRWREVDSPVGPVRALLPPVVMDGVDYAMGPIPDLGEQTERILGEFGYDAARVAALRDGGAI